MGLWRVASNPIGVNRSVTESNRADIAIRCLQLFAPHHHCDLPQGRSWGDSRSKDSRSCMCCNRRDPRVGRTFGLYRSFGFPLIFWELGIRCMFVCESRRSNAVAGDQLRLGVPLLHWCSALGDRDRQADTYITTTCTESYRSCKTLEKRVVVSF